MPKKSSNNLNTQTKKLLSEFQDLEKEFLSLKNTALKLLDKHQITKIKKRITKK